MIVVEELQLRCDRCECFLMEFNESEQPLVVLEGRLRRQAERSFWVRHEGLDYCDGCWLKRLRGQEEKRQGKLALEVEG